MEIKKKNFYFILAYVIYLVRALIETSTIKQYIVTDGIVYTGVRILILIFAILQIYTINRYSKKSIMEIFLISIIFLISGFYSRYTHLCDIILLVIASYKVELKTIIKTFFYVASIFSIVIFLLSIIGVIENYTFLYDTRRIRYAFGNVYATDFAAMMFYLQISYAFLKKDKYTMKFSLFWIIFGGFILYFCDARLDTILIVSFAIIIFLENRFRSFFEFKLIKWLLKYGIVLTCGFSIMIHALYNDSNSILEKVNKVLSGRLSHGHQAITDYGFSLFGTKIIEQGNGWSMSNWNDELGYYFVDCGYLSVALKYGAIILVVLVICYSEKIKRDLKNGEFTLPIILNFIGISSMIDHHILQIAYNPYIFVISVIITENVIVKNEMRDSDKCITQI